MNEPDEGQLTGTIKWPFSTENFKHPIQSPINIITSIAKENKDLLELRIHEPSLPGAMADVFNSGETVFVYIKEHDHDKLPYLAGGPLRDNFIFEQMHFHWGRADERGSEHKIDNKAFSVEIHMVHFNSKYDNFQQALTKDDGLAVLTIFAKIDSEDNDLLEPIHKLLPDLKRPNVHKELPWKEAMDWAISGMDVNTQYYTYPGSLTMPDYNQNVAFIILPIPITISSGQLTAFRDLCHDEQGDHITKNKRKIQDLNGRPIFKGSIYVEKE